MEEEDFEIGALLGGSIRAIQEAQIEAEREYMGFLLDYGLEEVSKKVGNKTVKSLKLRELTFNMNRTVSDPSKPGEVVETEAQVRAPLLSLIQMPAIGIEEATIELDLDVQTQSEEKEKPARATTARPLVPVSRLKTPLLKGAISNKVTSRNFRTHGKLSVKMTLRSTHDDDMHGRLARLAGEGVAALADVPEK